MTAIEIGKSVTMLLLIDAAVLYLYMLIKHQAVTRLWDRVDQAIAGFVFIAALAVVIVNTITILAMLGVFDALLR